MSAPFSNLQSKVDLAIKAVVDAVSLSNRGGALCFVNLDGHVELPLPRIEAGAAAGEEYIEATGLFWVSCVVAVFSTADGNTALADHSSRVAYVMDAIINDGLAAAMSAAVPDFLCQGIKNRTMPAQNKIDRHLITSIQFQALCCASD